MPDRVHLLQTDPDLGRHLSEEQRAAAVTLTVPVTQVPAGPLDLAGVLSGARAFGAIVGEGLLIRQIRVGEPTGLRLVGPGDVIGASATLPSQLVASSGYSAAAPTSLVLLGDEVLLASHRWPHLVVGLFERATDQVERAAVHLAICHLPRVGDRILALMWLLAESWGRVTPQGTALPIALTHEAIGGLIGARRPTVTLALGALTERGALSREDGGWLLIETLPSPAGAPGRTRAPRLISPVGAPPRLFPAAPGEETAVTG